MSMQTPEVILESRDSLGEVPIWCTRTSRLWWIDVRKPNIQSFDPSTGRHQVYPLKGRSVGSWAFRARGGMILSKNDGVYGFDPDTGDFNRLLALEADIEGHRLNDGRCDRLGRFWVGTMHDTVRNPTGSFYRIEADLKPKKIFGEVNIPNSTLFSPDDRLMYWADTPAGKIWVFDFDIDAGAISNRRVFRDFAGHPGLPDGSAIDVDGCVWNAEYGGSRIVRYTPAGQIDRVIELPVSQPTCCAFGGEHFDTLYITTASQKLSPEALASQPLAGHLFAIRPGVCGMPEPSFAG